MPKQSAVNLDITNNADGFDMSGGVIARKLTVTGGDVAIAGAGSATITFPTTSTTVAGLSIAQTFTSFQNFSSGISSNGVTGTINTAAQPNITSLGSLTTLTTAGLTSTQRVTISSGGLSVAGNIDGTIGTAAQPNITSLGSLTTLTTAGLTSTQRVNVSAGGIVVQAGGLSVTGGANLTGGSTFFGDIEVFDGAFIRTGGLSVTGGIAGTLVTPAQTNITSVGVLSGLSVNNGLSVTGSATITGGLNAYGNTTTWGSLLAKTTVSIESGGLLSNLGATFGDPNFGFGDDPVINLYRGNNELLRIGAARGGSFLGGLNNLYVFDILGPNAGQTRAVNFRRGTNFDGASASNHVTIMSFDQSDNVGIRTASPGATFDVAGTLRASGIGTFTGGLTANNLFVSQGATFANGIAVNSLGISVTGGIAGTIVTPAQTNITSLGTLTSLTTSGLLSTQALNVLAGATFGIDIYAPNMVTGVNGITGAVEITAGANVTITQTGKTITIASSGGGGGGGGVSSFNGLTGDVTGVSIMRGWFL